MFYAHFVLAKKGPLARIWLAAHWDKKLTKAHVFETNIEKSVDGILQPKVKMALRTSGHLLLGVVRIYSRKAKYLLADCNEAFVKIKMAFRPGMVDLPEEHREANVNAITLPEVFHDFDTAMPELNDVDIEAQFSLNQSRAEEITMREDYGSINLVTNDEGFGDMGFDAEPPELLKTVNALEPVLDQTSLLFSDGPPVDQINLEKEKEPQPSTSGGQSSQATLEIDAPIRGDGFGGNLGQDIIAGGLFEGGLFDDAPEDTSGEVPVQVTEEPEKPSEEPGAAADTDDDDMGDHFGAASVGGGSIDGDSRPATPAQGLLPEPPPPESQPIMAPPEPVYPEQVEEQVGNMSQEQTTLLQNEEESFALAPVDASALRGFTKTKRKRKLIVDEIKNISGEEMKAQLSDTSDIVTTLDLAPPTKRLMHWKETGGVEKLFALPGRPILARSLSKIYQRHLTSRAAENYDFGMIGDEAEDDLTFEFIKEIDAEGQNAEGKRLTRKRKLPETEEAGLNRKLSEQTQQELVSQDQVDLQQLITSASSVVPPATPQAYIPDPTAQPTLLQPEVPDMSTLATGALDPVHLASMVSSQTSGTVPVLTPAAPNLQRPPTPNITAPSSVLASPTSGLMPQPTPGPPPQHSIDVEVPQMPHLQADQVHSILEQHEPVLVSPITSTAVQLPVHVPVSVIPQSPPFAPSIMNHCEIPAEEPSTSVQPLTEEELPNMENMGYDLNNPLMANMGYDDQHPPAQTPGAISERGVATPWNEDYEFPASVGPPEEQQLDETYEQFEERVLNKRAGHMYHIVKSKLSRTDKLHLSEMTHRNNRKQVAQKFYTLLVLKKHMVLELTQEHSYDDIIITRGSKFENPSL